MSETKTAFAERTIRSLKNMLYRYIENNGYKYINQLSQFATTLNSTKNYSIDSNNRLQRQDTKQCKEIRLFSILYSKPQREFTKSKFKIRDRVRISKYDLPFRKCYKPQFTQNVFAIVAISSTKPLTYTKKDEQNEIIRGKFNQKELIKVI